MDIARYLDRIGYDKGLSPTIQTLNTLHRAHMMAVPFENLNVTLRKTIDLSLPKLYEKIVIQRRGGFCYELNALFFWLLKSLKFSVEILSARVITGGKPGPEFDHMLLIVDIGGQYIVDVGFGDSFLEPLPLEFKRIERGHRMYSIRESQFFMTYEKGEYDEKMIPQYVFSLTPRKIDDFTLMCHYHQTSPDSIFRKKSICSMATENGRITLSDGRLIITDAKGQKRINIKDETTCRKILKQYFNITLNEQISIDPLMSWHFSS